MENYEVHENKFMVKIDWLSFVVKNGMELTDVFFRFGMDISQFRQMPRGLKGYRSQYRYYIGQNGFVRVLYDGTEEMGINVEISGTAISYAIECFKESLRRHTPFHSDAYEVPSDCSFSSLDYLMGLYLRSVREIADVVRIDTAIDDFGIRYFTVSEVHELIKKKQLLSRFRSYRYTYGGMIAKNICEGETLYIGSTSSDAFIRVYDKGLEQKNEMDWVRWELQLRNEKANAYADELVHSKCVSTVAVGVFSGLIRFIELDNSNRSRCSTLAKWAEFIAGVEAVSLSIPKNTPSVDAKQDWIERQCLPTVAGLILAHGGDIQAVLGDMAFHFSRLSPALQSMFLNFLEDGNCNDTE